MVQNDRSRRMLADPPEPESPQPAPKTTSRRFIRVLAAVAAVTVSLAVVGAVAADRVRGTTVLLREDFSPGDESPFSTDTDRMVDLAVVGGEYRISIKDPRSPQAMRYVFDHTYDGLRFEADLSAVGDEMWVASIGCWAGDSAYLLGMFSTGEVALIETVSEARGERIWLTDEIATDVLGTAGRDRLRIDCVGGGAEPTIVTGWVNGDPVVSVAVPDGYDSFSAIGFWVGADGAGTVFAVDNVVAAAERPRPGLTPIPPIEDGSLTQGRHPADCGEVFAQAKEAFDAGNETEALDVIGFLAPNACATLAEAQAAAREQLGHRSSRGLEMYLARSCAYVGPSEGIRDTDLCHELLEIHPELIEHARLPAEDAS
jgi:hypothetical protein